MILLFLSGGLLVFYGSICFGDHESIIPTKKSIEDYLLTPSSIHYNGNSKCLKSKNMIFFFAFFYQFFLSELLNPYHAARKYIYLRNDVGEVPQPPFHFNPFLTLSGPQDMNKQNALLNMIR